MVALAAQLILMTGLAIGLLLLMYWGLKRNPRWLAWLQGMGASSTPVGLPQAPLSIESRLNLDARKSFMVIRSGDERYLVGLTPERIDTVTRMGDISPAGLPDAAVQEALATSPRWSPAATAQAAGSSGSYPAGAPSFNTVLNQFRQSATASLPLATAKPAGMATDTAQRPYFSPPGRYPAL